ncbi:hypothetical protein BGZ59_004034 [Podila verticillata]|nr:hypothetical protein BGZ59_004034 [Podila verticillata]KFH68912.1 hypothetical protein MVEG_05716 [Podila verticillata NRRL 6337]
MEPRNAQHEDIPDVEDQRYLPRLMRNISLSLAGETPKPPPVPTRPKNDSSESWLSATLVTPETETQTQPHHQHNPSSQYQDRPMQAQAEYKNETHVRSTTKTVELEPISPKSHNRLSTFLRDLDPSEEGFLAESQEPKSSPSAPSSPHRHQQPHQVMLKRSSQLYPLNQSARQLKRHQVSGQPEPQHPYPELSRSNSNDNEKFEVNDEELKRLGQVLKRKKEHDAVVRRVSMSSTSSLSSASSEREMDKGESSQRPRPGVLTRACGCVHLGFAAFLVCTLMLVYNSILGALVLQASRYPSATNTNTVIFAFSILYLVTAALALPGFLSLYLIYRARSTSSLSAFPSRLFRSFHWLYLTTTLLKLTAMLAWLGINKLQTGAWDHLRLPSTTTTTTTTTATTIPPPSFSLETLLVQDPTNPDIWVLNPALWIAGFVAVFAVEVYAWVCLWAYGRRYMMDQTRRRMFLAVEGDPSGAGSRVNLVQATTEKK